MSDSSSLAEEIPFRKKRKSPEKKVVAGNTQIDDDEGMEEDEYAVESIVDHRFRRNALELLVKWQGYPIEESTWEPEQNLDNCVEDLNNYFDRIGGRPSTKAASSATKSIPVKKRKLSPIPSVVHQPLPPEKGNKPGRKKKEEPIKLQQKASTSSKNPNPAAGVFPEDSWEDFVLNVDTMEKDDPTGRIFAYIVWKDNAKTRHPTEVVYQKCPQKCLQFYEAHLQFHTPDPPKPISHNGDSTAQEMMPRSVDDLEATAKLATVEDANDNDDEEEEGMEVGIKGVASSVA